MSINASSKFIDPSAIERLVAKNKVVAVPQLALAFGASKATARGLSTRIDLAIASLLAKPNPPCEAFELIAHPGAIDSWGLLWNSNDTELSHAREIPIILLHHWKHLSKSTRIRLLCHSSATQLCARLREVDTNLWDGDAFYQMFARWDAASITARILRTSVWLHLAEHDPVAAESWQAHEPDSGDPFGIYVSASYERSDGKRVWAVVPTLDPLWTSEENVRYALIACYLSEQSRREFIELYSLRFRSGLWPTNHDTIDG